MKVWVANYSHSYGIDTRVFSSEKAALAWGESIAKEWWDHEFPDEKVPSENIRAKYFQFQIEDGGDGETFTVEEIAVESSADNAF